MARNKLKVIPLGGLGEIGRNMLVLEYGEDLVIIDAGLMFPDDEMLGIDLVIPDLTHVLERANKIRGVVITHGHEDHTGALPYLLSRVPVPVYATRLTEGLISVKLKEHKLLEGASLNVIQPGDEVKLGVFRLEFFSVCHSIPDGVGVAVHTPVGTVVHSGDFKLDHTPVDGKLTDFPTLARLGSQGVLLLLSDSTRAEIPGYTPSESEISLAMERVIGEAQGRVIIATFASLISRVQQVIDAAAKHDRRLAVMGRSMVNNVRMAQEMGYLQVPPGMLVRAEEMAHLPPHQVVIITTGAQGEPTSVLTRLATGDHKQLRIHPGDTVLISASAIPGNEQLVHRTIDNLFKKGASVIYQDIAKVHVSGHASQEELKMMISLVRPKFFVPIHGEYRQLKMHAILAQSLGIPQEHTFVLENGEVLELGPNSARVVTKVPAGYVYVDGLGVGDISHVVLRDRRLLAQDGILVVLIAVDGQTGKVVGRPDIVSRGFVYMRESEELIEEARDLVSASLDHGGDRLAERAFIHNKIKDVLSKFIYERTKRRPMILPVVVEV
ncbi:MAG TPA: ribonuclease J [Dehalococcoidia bacterium]|nr:ribonuclease J [Dehalococcoidia bacterium]